jgi:hypothetical protein
MADTIKYLLSLQRNRNGGRSPASALREYSMIHPDATQDIRERTGVATGLLCGGDNGLIWILEKPIWPADKCLKPPQDTESRH